MTHVTIYTYLIIPVISSAAHDEHPAIRLWARTTIPSYQLVFTSFHQLAFIPLPSRPSVNYERRVPFVPFAQSEHSRLSSPWWNDHHPHSAIVSRKDGCSTFILSLLGQSRLTRVSYSTLHHRWQTEQTITLLTHSNHLVLGYNSVPILAFFATFKIPLHPAVAALLVGGRPRSSISGISSVLTVEAGRTVLG